MKSTIKGIMHRISIGFIFLVLTCTQAAYAQLSVNNLTWYTEKDGLPGTQVNKIIVDQFGYIWIGTINGLSRYDGYNFKRFFQNPNDPGSIKGHVIWTLFEDSKGQIWVGSQPGKLNVYNPVTQSFRHYEFTDLVESELNGEIGIVSITEDSSGRIYFGVTSLYSESLKSTLLYFDEKDKKVKKVITPEDVVIDNIKSLITDKNGNVWISCWSGIFKINKEGNIYKVTPNMLSGSIFLQNEYEDQLFSDPSGYVWGITNFARLFHVDIETYETEIIAPIGIMEDYYFNNLAMDEDGAIWLGTNTGLFKFDPKTSEVTEFDDLTMKDYQYSAVNTLAMDSFGSVWIGTNSTGMYKYEERSIFKSFVNKINDPQSITGGWVNNMLELKDGNILVTTSGGGVNIVDLKKNEVFPLPFQKSLPGTHTIFGIIEQSIGEFLFCANNGFFQFSYPKNQFKRINLPGISPNTFILYFLNDSKGYQWAFTNQGIYRKNSLDSDFQKTAIIIEPEDENSLKAATRAYESNKYGLWIITNDGLFLYDYKSNRINRVGLDPSKSDVFVTQDVNALYEDSVGTVWVGTWQGGLSRYDVKEGKIKTYTIDDGLPSMSIQSIIADEKNQSL
ncbi:two-component regulator propeller domain-containing protein, partial [Aquiflexum sp.]|uniref:ligand-binding sensor domain-containing protein n=1 Tax=Aquiflexum sp. TaxID=1872584 RepID=UPI0035932AD3